MEKTTNLEEELTILTYKEHYVDLATGPTIEQVDIEDIAHHLSLQCRFAGAVNHFYSIAEHSLYVALLANKLHAPYYLLHDSAETWYQDLTKPLKKLLLRSTGVYEFLTDQCDKTVFTALNLNYEGYLNLKRDIKKIDQYVYSLERKMLCGRRKQILGLDDNHPLAKAKFGMEPQEAEEAFLKFYYESIA